MNLSFSPSLSAPVSDPASEVAVSGMYWDTAISVLLQAAGRHEDIKSVRSLAELSRKLRGSGLELTRVPVHHGIISTGEEMIGCIVLQNSGFWLPVQGVGEEAVLLTSTGKKAGPFHSASFLDVQEAWVLKERIINLASVLPFIQRYKQYFSGLFMAALVVNLFGLVLPLFSSFVYDKILGNGIVETLWALTIGLLIVVFMETAVRIVRSLIAEQFSVVSEAEIDHATFHNLMDTSTQKMPSFGGFIEKYKQVVSFRDFLSSSYLLAAADIPFLFIYLIVIAIVAGPLVFIPLICGILMLVVNFVFATPVLVYDRHARVAAEKRFGLISDLFASREAIIGGPLRHVMAERWRHFSHTAVQSGSMARHWRGLGMTLAGMLSSLSYIFVIVGGVYLIEGHELTSGGLLAASMLSSRTIGGFASAITIILRYREFRTAMRELNGIIPVQAHAKPMRNHGILHGGVRLDRVTCRLREGEAPVLEKVNLLVHPGELVGVAGLPGAGKTTLLRVIAGVVDVEEGRVLIDNIPIASLSPDDIGVNIGYKPQEYGLLDGTIEDNVRAGRPPLTPEQRRDVLYSSGLLRMFEAGAIDWKTDVGPRGANLSGGQRQMVALARAFLARPPILLLDEPSNGFDAGLEQHLAQYVASLKGRSTVFLSSHCRALLSVCDRIIVVGQGGFMADGSKDKVLAN